MEAKTTCRTNKQQQQRNQTPLQQFKVKKLSASSGELQKVWNHFSVGKKTEPETPETDSMTVSCSALTFKENKDDLFFCDVFQSHQLHSFL